jgi:hypothetical protein
MDPELRAKVDDLAAWLRSRRFSKSHCARVFADVKIGNRSVLTQRGLDGKIKPEELAELTKRVRLYFGGMTPLHYKVATPLGAATPLGGVTQLDYIGTENPRGNVTLKDLGLVGQAGTFGKMLLESGMPNAVTGEAAVSELPNSDTIFFTILSDTFFTEKNNEREKERASLLHELLHAFLASRGVDNNSDQRIRLLLDIKSTRPEDPSYSLDISDFLERDCRN